MRRGGGLPRERLDGYFDPWPKAAIVPALCLQTILQAEAAALPPTVIQCRTATMQQQQPSFSPPAIFRLRVAAEAPAAAMPVWIRDAALQRYTTPTLI